MAGGWIKLARQVGLISSKLGGEKAFPLAKVPGTTRLLSKAGEHDNQQVLKKLVSKLELKNTDTSQVEKGSQALVEYLMKYGFKREVEHF